MRILFLTQIIPYPPDAGPRIKTWHVLNYLAERGHEITLVSFVRPEEQPFISDVKRVCAQVHTAPIRRSQLKNIFYLAKSQLTRRPYLIERDDLGEMRSLVDGLLQRESFDYALADQLTMTQFLIPKGGPKGRDKQRRPQRIFDAHNAVWTIVERMRQAAPWYLKPLAGIEAQRVKRYESMLVREFEHTLAVTSIDEKDLLTAVSEIAPGAERACAEKITVIPIAVDTVRLAPIQRQAGSANILTLGSLHYPPNADGIRWFAREVFPLIARQMPDVTLTIVGKNPPADFHQMAAENPGVITVTGYVPELKPYMEQAALMVIPVRAGSGMRVRILEALALAMPLVTTTIGLEGIDARHGEEVLVADTVEDFAAAVTRLMGDADLQARLAKNGRRLAERAYDWRVVLSKLDQVIRPLNEKN
jgi:glycosyltransferase involved in cell wall biosynthesis